MPAPSPVIVWFRDDLRLSDHPALSEAAAHQAPLVCLYVYDEKASLRPLGGAARWWLAQSLRALDHDIRAKGGSLVLRKGPAAQTVSEIAGATKASAVFWNRIDARTEAATANNVAAALRGIGVEAHESHGDLLADPLRIRGASGSGMRVFTPFWKRLQNLGDPVKAPARAKEACPGARACKRSSGRLGS